MKMKQIRLLFLISIALLSCSKTKEEMEHIEPIQYINTAWEKVYRTGTGWYGDSPEQEAIYMKIFKDSLSIDWRFNKLADSPIKSKTYKYVVEGDQQQIAELYIIPREEVSKVTIDRERRTYIYSKENHVWSVMKEAN